MMIKKGKLNFWLNIRHLKLYFWGIVFFLIIFLGQTFISLDTPPTYNKYYNIFSQGNFIINSTDVNYDLFTFLIDCLSRCGQKSGSDFLVPTSGFTENINVALANCPQIIVFF